MLCRTTHGTMLQETRGQQQSKDTIFSFIFFDKSLTLLSGNKSLKMVMQYQTTISFDASFFESYLNK